MKKTCHSEENKRWSALDSSNPHPSFKNATVSEAAAQESKTYQVSEEYIEIVDSADVQVTTTDTKAALSIQAALQAAIVVVVSISIAD
ncbi:spore coat protein, partial [Bacillus cereus]|nr:spore coat protein [Bacillus cereus]